MNRTEFVNEILIATGRKRSLHPDVVQNINNLIDKCMQEELEHEVKEQSLPESHKGISGNNGGIKSLRIIRPKELAELLQVSTVTIWRMENEGDLPNRKQISNRCVGWLESDIEEWLQNRPNATEIEN